MSAAVTAPTSPVFLSPQSPVFSPTAAAKTSPSSPRLLLTPELTCQARRHYRSVSDHETSLKRKRPPRLDVGAAVTTAAAWNAAEAVEETPRAEDIAVDEDGYSVYCKRGKRGPMEDRYFALVDPKGAHIQGLFGVLDGHGGAKAAEYAAMNLDRNIKEGLEQCYGEEGWMERGIRVGYLRTDEEFLKQGVRGGTCCVTALISNDEVAVSNAGDCRAVVSRHGAAEPLTSDHHPSVENELKRIEALGGYVDCCNGVWRIQGTLAVSRGIGDRYLKQWVTAEPETKTLHIKPELEFLILASDGLWDKVTNQEAVDMVRPWCVGLENPKTLSACKKLAELSAERGCLDDISIIIVHLQRFVP
ncbi:PREDICTED: probable protein phosphatase 2C 30 [Tarenaya hassleriana]|uniref:probable protein phosphatase 2C 30 n=1 Tax=Tarenaya hassleriana TaxID=28532 RepID=UPI00053C428E|nr:PREDICTED: probable protein phosphatase 2C 30 [Tarenaya hassleriana]